MKKYLPISNYIMFFYTLVVLVYQFLVNHTKFLWLKIKLFGPIYQKLVNYQIPLHIKPVKVPTISNDLSQNFFWKKVPLFWNKNSKFQKTVIKKAHSMNRFQKFLCVVDGHEETDVLVFWLFWLWLFLWFIFQDLMD